MDAVEILVQVQTTAKTPNRIEGDAEISTADTETPIRVESDNDSKRIDQQVLLQPPPVIFGQTTEPEETSDEPVAKKLNLNLEVNLDLPKIPTGGGREDKWKLPAKLADYL